MRALGIDISDHRSKSVDESYIEITGISNWS